MGPSQKNKLEMESKFSNNVKLRNGAKAVELDVVDEYKRVGTTKTPLAGLGREINVRATAVWHKTRALRKRLFRAPVIKQDVKCATLRTLFLSSQLFNAGAWPEMLIGSTNSANPRCCGLMSSHVLTLTIMEATRHMEHSVLSRIPK